MFKKILICALMLLMVNVAFAGDETHKPESVEQQLNVYQQNNKIPGMVVYLYTKGKLDFFSIGYADLELKKEMTESTIFKLGEVSELFTALLLTKLVDVGRLQLDYKVSKYVPDLSPAFNQIDLLQLATQTSGLPNQNNRGIQSQHDLNQFLSYWQNQDKARHDYRSSALNYEILATVIKKRQKNWYNSMLKKYVLQPLKMQPIATSLSKQLRGQLAKAYDSDNKIVNKRRSSLFESSIGVMASAKDMQQFLAAMIGLGKMQQDMLYPIRMTQVAYVDLINRQQGLGWDIYSLDKARLKVLLNNTQKNKLRDIPEIPTFDKDSYFDKLGQVDGFTSYMAVMPSRKSGIVVLANKQVDKIQLQLMARKLLLKENNINIAVDNNK